MARILGLMKSHQLILAFVSVVAVIGLVTQYSGSSDHIFFAENICKEPGKIPILVSQTDYGTGKMWVQQCVPEGSVIHSWGGSRFPSLRQRWKTPGGRITY